MSPAARDAVAALPAPTRRADSVEVWPTLFAHMPPGPLRDACEARHAMGIERYGQPLVTFDGRETRVDLLQELLDCAAYAQKVWLEGGGRDVSPISARQLRMAEAFVEEAEDIVRGGA